jgi:cell division protein FtsI (penicillin-binding protein 3)
MSMDLTAAETPIHLEGGRKARKNLTRTRIRLAIFGLFVIFAIIGGRLVQLGIVDTSLSASGQARAAITATRPVIYDRNGMEMAMDIRVPSLYAEPRRIIDVDEAVEKLAPELPGVTREWLRNKLDGNEGFVWLEREMTPAAQRRIFNLGIPGIGFVTESKRFYPGGEQAAHILGAVNVDNQGIAGIERYLDEQDVEVLQETGLARGRSLEPVTLSIDMRVQFAMHAELKDAITRYQAIGAAGAIVDIRTGEVLALVSLPDFDPNVPASALEEGRLNKITGGTFELGSTYKTVTLAGALDSGIVQITDEFDATKPIRFGRFTINDYRGKGRFLTLPEVYKYSSNIGTIRIMQTWGKENYRAFLTKIGFDDPLKIELPETTRSNIPEKFSDIVAATASFGHGLAITPMHMVSAVAAFVNNGNYVPATLFPRSQSEAQALYTPLISQRTSDYVRYLMRLNALEGSGRKMNQISEGYLVGGKTGTADKVVDGRYDNTKNLNTFVSAFPLDNPRYAMIIMVDEPKAENEQSGRTAGWNAAMMTGRVVKRIAPLLGITPDFSEMRDLGLIPAELRVPTLEN